MLDQTLTNFLKKSTGLIDSPIGMRSLGLFQYTESETNNCYRVGWVKYLAEEEANNSNQAWPDFSYYINDLGFRGNYPSVDTKGIIGVFGCSVAFGQGLPEEETFPKLITDQMDKQHINLGITGAGCHRIALTFSSATKIWDIDTAVVVLPRYTRMHYVDKENHLHSILLSYKMGLEELESVRLDVLKHFSEQYLLAQAIDSIQWILDIAKLKNIKLLLATWDLEMIQIAKEAFGLDIILFDTIDKARDGQHPGRESHKAFAGKIINNL